LQVGLAVFWAWDYFPSMIGTLEIERLSFAERLQAMELLWRSMSSEPDKLESPDWHKKILAKRLAKVEAGKGEFLTLTQLKKRLAKFVEDDVRSL
jgi:putative addiction module component (TIGR02574 family)